MALRDSMNGIVRDMNFDEDDIETAKKEHVDYRSPTMHTILQSTTASDSSRVDGRAGSLYLPTYPGPRKREEDTDAGSIYRGREREEGEEAIAPDPCRRERGVHVE